MLWIHGGGVSGWMWDKQIRYFTDYHCVVPDLIDEKEPTFSIHGSAKQLLELIEEKAVGKQVNVVGFSLGAQIIVQMLSLKPQLIDAAIINSALVRPAPLAGKMVKPLIKLSFPLIKNKYFSKLQAKTMYIDDQYFDHYYQDSITIELETLVRILEENMTFTIPKNFHQAPCKILVTVGEKEKAMMKKSANDLVKSNPRCKGVILSGIGHGISFSNPEFFNRMIENWIRDDQIPEGKVI